MFFFSCAAVLTEGRREWDNNYHLSSKLIFIHQVCSKDSYTNI